MIPLDKLEAHLHQYGYRMTHPRQVVFEFFSLAREPIQFAQIVDMLRPMIDRASIYRTVELFVKLGILAEVHRPGRRWLELGEAFNSHHHHITCANCGLSKTIENPQFEEALVWLANRAGFKVTSHQLEMTGYCRDCLALSRNQQVVK